MFEMSKEILQQHEAKLALKMQQQKREIELELDNAKKDKHSFENAVSATKIVSNQIKADRLKEIQKEIDMKQKL